MFSKKFSAQLANVMFSTRPGIALKDPVNVSVARNTSPPTATSAAPATMVSRNANLATVMSTERGIACVKWVEVNVLASTTTLETIAISARKDSTTFQNVYVSSTFLKAFKSNV